MNRGSRFIVMLLLACALSALGTWIFESGILTEDSELFWLFLLALACILPVVIAVFRRSFDPFEPVYPVIVATFIYFCLMPLILMGGQGFWMAGIDYGAEISRVLFLTLLALIGFYLFYYGCSRRTGRAVFSLDMNGGNRAYAHRCAAVCLALFSGLFLLWIIVAQVPLWSLWIFGSASYGTWNEVSTGAKLGHLYSAIEALPACFLLLVATRSKRRWTWSSLVLLVLITLLFAGLGIRARLLLLPVGAFVYWHLEKGTRPSGWHNILLGFLVFYFVIGAVGYYRGTDTGMSGGSRPSLSSAYEAFVEGSNIVTTTAAYTRWVPVYGYDYGRNFLEVLLTPIPSAVWPDKYSWFGVSPIEQYRSTGAAAAFFAEFYESLGAAGVLLGMGVIGIVCRRVYDNCNARRRDCFAQVSLALLWGFLFHAYGRNSTTLIFYGAAYVFAPIVVVRYMVTRRWRIEWEYRRNRTRMAWPAPTPASSAELPPSCLGRTGNPA